MAQTVGEAGREEAGNRLRGPIASSLRQKIQEAGNFLTADELSDGFGGCSGTVF